MTLPKKDRQRHPNPPPFASPHPQQPTPERPQTLLQRISSLLPSLPHSRSTPAPRPKSTPPVTRRHSSSRRNVNPYPDQNSDSETILPPTLIIPTISDSNEICPYDPHTYYSFPKLENLSNRFLYGLISRNLCRRESTVSSSASVLSDSRPCGACRTRSACSHLALRRAGSRGEKGLMFSSTRSSRPGSLARFGLHEVLGPRPRPYTASPTRVRFEEDGRRPSRIRVSQLPALNTVLASSSGVFASPSSATSPKLHHIHGLSRPNEYPYVHKHEAKQHLAAQQAGLPSPLSFIGSTNPSPELPATVYYSRGVSPDARRASSPLAHTYYTSIDWSINHVNSSYEPVLLDPLPDPEPHHRETHNPHNRAIFHPSPSSPSSSVLAHITHALPATSALEFIQAAGSVTVDRNSRSNCVSLEWQTSPVDSRGSSPEL